MATYQSVYTGAEIDAAILKSINSSVVKSLTNGNIKVNGAEVQVYVHPDEIGHIEIVEEFPATPVSGVMYIKLEV